MSTARSAPCHRRDFLWGAGALAAVATTSATTARAASAGTSPGRGEPTEPRRELEAGLVLGACRLVEVLPVDNGALPFLLMDPAGHRFVVELHVHDPGVRGIARAGSYDVFLRNGGSGRTKTNEAHGIGAMALASIVAEREAAGHPMPPLASIVERWASDPPPLFR